MDTNQEAKNKRIAAATTFVVNAAILLLMIFIGSWKMAGEGDGDYPGIEVNLGYDEQGSGDIEPMTPIGDEKATDDEDAPAEKAEEPVDEKITAPAVTPPPAETKVAETSKVLTDPNSDVEIKEKPKEEKPVEKVVEKKPEVPVEKPVEKKPDPVPTAVYKKPSGSTDATKSGDGTGKQGTEGNQGDDVGKEGNKGVPGGTPGAAVYKGTPGGGDGGSLELNGWDWDNIPKPNIQDGETGRVVFNIEVDENGELIRYTKESGTVSAAAERACVAAIQKLTFTKKSGAKVPPVSKGKITFVIRAQ
jgi:periplasmic protein TonB